MTKKEYEEEKNNIFLRANERVKKIMNKYKGCKGEGLLDGAPWTKEMREDSKIILEELQELDKKYDNQI